WMNILDHSNALFHAPLVFLPGFADELCPHWLPASGPIAPGISKRVGGSRFPTPCARRDALISLHHLPRSATGQHQSLYSVEAHMPNASKGIHSTPLVMRNRHAVLCQDGSSSLTLATQW